jgi:erythromycin esterase
MIVFVLSLVLAAAPIRSLDPSDTDFADLQPLAAAIGNARVVQLGEATHGDGATFMAKARLIRFLHERMGFDVVAWESGFVDVRLAAAALRAGSRTYEVAQRGLYATWQVREVMPTLAYIQKSQMDLVGFDCRVARPRVRAEDYPKLIFDFFDALDPALISKKERDDFVTMSKGLVPADYYAKPGPRDFNRALPARLLDVIDHRRAELLAHFAPREIDYVRQSLVSFLNMDRALGRGDKPPFSEGYSRDAAMAANLLWWLNGPLRDRKVIVWAHNYHVMNDSVSEKAAGKPMGWFLKRQLGAELYTIGFTAYGGTFRSDEEKTPKIEPGALEMMLHAEGRAQSFLDLSRLPPDHPLRKATTASFYFHQPQSAAWPRIYDGVVFIDTEKAATPVLQLHGQ